MSGGMFPQNYKGEGVMETNKYQWRRAQTLREDGYARMAGVRVFREHEWGPIGDISYEAEVDEHEGVRPERVDTYVSHKIKRSVSPVGDVN